MGVLEISLILKLQTSSIFYVSHFISFTYTHENPLALLTIPLLRISLSCLAILLNQSHLVQTSFPKGNDGRGNAFKVHPKKGSAMLFYNLLEDGNGDDLAMHAALPVVHGEKYLANFWVWDPKRVG